MQIVNKIVYKGILELFLSTPFLTFWFRSLEKPWSPVPYVAFQQYFIHIEANICIFVYIHMYSFIKSSTFSVSRADVMKLSQKQTFDGQMG